MTQESHTYGLLDIGIEMHYHEGIKRTEIYFVNKRLASRKRYEKACADYSDMPPPDPSVDDFSGELLKAMSAERRQWSQAARNHIADPGEALKIDTFCRSMLKKGKTAHAEAWIKSAKHSLGELSHSKSCKLIDKLTQLGATQLHVCDIDEYGNGEENTGHIVIELPDDAKTRKALFREVGRLASKQGFQGEFDNGQQYAYIGLD